MQTDAVPHAAPHLSAATFVYTEQQRFNALFSSIAGIAGRSPILPIRLSTTLPLRFSRNSLFALALVFCAIAPAWGRQAADQSPPAPQSATGSGIIQGVVMNRDQAVYEGAQVALSVPSEAAPRHAVTDANGRFQFSEVPPGKFTISVSAAGFATATIAGLVQSGQTLDVPAIVLSLASSTTDVNVTASRQEIATEQVKLEEQQRVLGFIPNFYVVYDANPAPLSPRQKFSLAWHDSVDPITFLSAGFFAGIEQAQNTFAGYGQGAQGYAKRYGADYADGFPSDMLGGALFPSLFHQDPRYYYKGKGSVASRTLHAVAMSFLCKGDNGHWQFNYSALAGDLAAGGISNLYYPSSDRDSFTAILDTTAIGIGEGADRQPLPGVRGAQADAVGAQAARSLSPSSRSSP